MTVPRLDLTIHAPHRLHICALLTPLDEAEFQVLREALGISDSALSKHIKQLEDAGYLILRKATRDGRQRTWARLTPTGRRAFAAHVDALTEIASLAHGSRHG
ncbi:MAG: transcriptional regulator [Actinomycetota bacterium]|nr:transcriptional regulator [Actinomycetota bacterium]